jgi:hypothetical protein
MNWQNWGEFGFESSSGYRMFAGAIEVLAIHAGPGGAGADMDRADVVAVILAHLERIPGFSWDLHIARESDPADGLTFTSAFLSGDDDPVCIVARVEMESWVAGEGVIDEVEIKTDGVWQPARWGKRSGGRWHYSRSERNR